MPLEIDTYHAALVDDSGSGTDGTIWDKADVATIKDAYLSLGASTELTIAADAVTVTRNKHSVDTQADAASDDLSTITSGTDVIDGHVVVLKAENVARVVTVKDGVGNILLKGGDFVMNDAEHRLVLVRDGSNWYEVSRNTTSSSLPSVIVFARTSISLDTDVNDYNPTGFHSNTVFHLAGASANRSITGLDSTGVADGTIKIFHNRSAFSYTFEQEHASSSAANRIRSGGSADAVLRADGTLELVYNATRWCALVP